MGEEVREAYIINPDTMAVFSNLHPTNVSKILEPNRVIYCRKTPKQIITESCLMGGSTLIGRQMAMEKILQTKSKLPVPVNPSEGTFMFPTMSPRNMYCGWISFYHVKEYEENKGDQGSKVMFSDESIIDITTSGYSIKRQMQLTGLAIATFSRSLYMKS
ncbi:MULTISPECIES: competence protein ComK [Pontibacillus]|uniref:Competence protein ComK n=1 Tax=Pontibacillus chungwhensis TaxID=265426 RepID=A0ABY8UWH2_9BACI|nr:MULTISPECIES: competence protein ComK [Pontibacillus]MCD5324091.1 competence protein ComK [Pontibacillus sp. HN14]WIF97852.1 competence protein ComK [Pontibacillus chungwhensis]